MKELGVVGAERRKCINELAATAEDASRVIWSKHQVKDWYGCPIGSRWRLRVTHPAMSSIKTQEREKKKLSQKATGARIRHGTSQQRTSLLNTSFKIG